MSDVSGIPNLGIPAMGGFNQGGFFADPSSGYQAAQAQYGRNNAYFGNQAATLAAAHMPQSQLYGGGSFGAQPAAYAALGAAYGRNTGGFRPPAGGANVFQTGATPFQSYGLPGGGGMGAFSPSPNYPGGRDAIARAMQPQYSPDFNSTFAQFGFHPQQMQQQPAYDLMRQFNGVGTGVPAYNVPKSAPPSAGELGRMNFTPQASSAAASGGGFYPGAFNPAQYAPANRNPFIGGASPQPYFPAGGGFGGIGSLQAGGQYGGRGNYPALVGASQDAYGNPFIQGNAPTYALQAGRMGGGYGIGGLGQGTAFRGVPGR